MAYLLVSSLLGITATLSFDYFENIAVERSLRKELEQEVTSVAVSFRRFAGADDDARRLAFLKSYAGTALANKVVVREVIGAAGDPRTNDFLFSVSGGSRRLDFYVDSDFLQRELANLNLPELLFGFLTTFVLFAAFTVLSDRREKVRVLREQFQVQHDEMKKVLAEHEALALLGRMSATLAHELKTPFATISNLIQVLPSRLHDQAFTDRFLVLTRQELQRTEQLINNLLAYGKDLDARQGQWLDFPSLLRERAAKQALQVEIAFDGGIFADRFYLELLLDNLFRNSKEAGARRVKVGCRKEGREETALLFEDDGRGYPAEVDLASLTSPFVTCRSNGAGLGLYLATKIAAAHRAALTLYRPETGAGVRLGWPQKEVKLHGAH